MLVEVGIIRLCEARVAHMAAVSVRCAHCGGTRYAGTHSAAHTKKPPEGEALSVYGAAPTKYCTPPRR